MVTSRGNLINPMPFEKFAPKGPKSIYRGEGSWCLGVFKYRFKQLKRDPIVGYKLKAVGT